MDLWEDSGFNNEYEAKEVQASSLVYVKIDVENLDYRNNFQARPLRCWQTLTPDGAGDRYKNIISNGLVKSVVMINHRLFVSRL